MALHGLSGTRVLGLLAGILLLSMAGAGSPALGASPLRTPTHAARTATDLETGVEPARARAAVRNTLGKVHWKRCGIDHPGQGRRFRPRLLLWRA